MSYEPVANSDLVAVVTFLEMRERPATEIAPSSLRLQQIENADVASYRDLFRLVGAPWLWFSRLAMSDDKLAAIIGHPLVEIYAVHDEQGHDAGMIELDFREPGQSEIAFLGLIPELSGKGHGRWLLGETLCLAWRDGIERVHVHTCSLDHPAALSAYRRAGFKPYKRAIERFPDPRLLGILPRDCASQIPLLAG